MSYDILERAERAMLKVRERLIRSTTALADAGLEYAVVGGHAVASWVATVDEGAMRNTRDVDLLVRREDLPRVTEALEKAGFVADEFMDVVKFRDGAAGKPSEAVHLLFAGEKVRPDHPFASPEIRTVLDPARFRVLVLESLLEMKLLSHRLKDRVHIQDLIGVGLIDASWLPKLPPLLAERLQVILDDPHG